MKCVKILTCTVDGDMLKLKFAKTTEHVYQGPLY